MNGKRFQVLFPKATWNKIVKENDNTSWSDQVFQYFAKISEQMNLTYKREKGNKDGTKERNDFTMETLDREKILHIEHENIFKLKKMIANLKKLAISPYPLKIFIGDSQNKDFEGDMAGIDAEISKIQKEHNDQVWLVIQGINAKGSWFPATMDDYKAFLWVGNEGKVEL